MKNHLILLSFLLSITQLYAQQTVTINGKIKNGNFRDGSLKKEWYNTQTMSIEDETTDFEVSGDGGLNVQLKVENIVFTRCWLRLGGESILLYIAPDDSLFITADADHFSDSIMYAGKGAGRNNYRKEVYKMFMNQDVENEYLRKDGPDKFIQNLDGYVDKKMALLNKYFNSGEIDSNYYQFEKQRIEIYKAAKLLKHLIRYKTDYATESTIKEFNLLTKYAESNNSQYLQEGDFRELITDYPDYKLKFSSDEYKTSINDKIDFAKKNYKGLVLTYYFHKLIYSCVDNAASPVDREIVLTYLAKNIDDPSSVKLIAELKHVNVFNHTSNGDIFVAALVAIISIVFLVLLLFLITKIFHFLGRSNFRFNHILLIRNSLYLIALILAFNYIKRFHIIGVLTVLLWLFVYIVHNYVVIPRYVARKKYYQYTTSLILMMVIFATVHYLLSVFYYEMGYLSFRESFFLRIPTYILFGYFIIIISWIGYYINILAKEKISIKKLVKEKRLNLEVIFNICLVSVCYFIFVVNQSSRLDLLRMLPFYTTIIIFYLQTFFIIPNSFKKDKLPKLIISNVLILLVIALGMVVVNTIHSYISVKKLGIGVSVIDVININKSINIEKLLVSLFIIVPAFMYTTIKKQLLKNESSGYLLFRKKEAELEQLRSQVNPHFLFNTLNTLYAFALKEKSEKTAECIAKLANLMRFMIDDMSKDYILLKNEIGYIQDYIKLQSIRSSVEHDIKINIDIEEDKMYQIAPMLLIPFVENAFKHGINPNEISQLKIDIKCKDKQIQVVIENSIDANFEAYYKEKGFGIGIENVKKRLAHIYPGKHNISVAKTDDRFIVIIKIEVNNSVS